MKSNRLIAAAFAAGLFLSPMIARAAEAVLPPPAIDFSAVLTDPSGKPIPVPPTGDGQAPAGNFTLGAAASAALFGNYPDEQNLSGQKKYERGALAMKIKDGGKVVLSPAEVQLIEDMIGKAYSPLVVMRAWPLLDPTKAAAPK